MSSLKTSRHALLSKLSEMAPATVPAASRLECSDDAPQATVELRLTPLMRILRRSRVLLRSALASHCLSLVFVRCFHPSPRRAARDGGRAPGPALSLSPLAVCTTIRSRHTAGRGEAPCWRVASAGSPLPPPLCTLVHFGAVVAGAPAREGRTNNCARSSI